jgi:hypothetical protein
MAPSTQTSASVNKSAREGVSDQRLFTFGSCEALRAVCRVCDRGQEYCPGACRRESRRRIAAEARRRHRRTEEGRRDHRDYERAWRARKRRRVGDLGSEDLARWPTVCGPAPASGSAVDPSDDAVRESHR